MNDHIAATTNHPYMSEEVYERLQARYALVLDAAKSFLAKKRVTKSGGTISSIRKSTLENNQADCPQCGQVFRGANHNTEHIHDKALGGAKSCKKNRIQICKMCNNSRSTTMVGFINGPPYYRQFKAQWPKIEAYLLWSELTIDDGIQAGAQIPDVHSLFLEARFAGEMPDGFYPKRAYGRFSTWDVGSQPNYPHNRTTIGRPLFQGTGGSGVSTPTIKSFVGRMSRAFFDRLFDYNPAAPQSSQESTIADNDAVVELPKVSADDQKETPSLPTPPPAPLEIDVDGLRRQWCAVLNEEFSLTNGVIPLGVFWDMIAKSRQDSGLAWRAFEKAFQVRHRGSMPAKASEFLEQMGYSFIFVKTESGYLIHLSCEEE